MEIDFHVHTKYSFDSYLMPEKIIKIAKKKGLNGVAITDHGTIQGGLATRVSSPNSFIVIVGAEIKTEFGDIVGLFLNEEIKSHRINEVIDEISDQSGLIVLPHPFREHNLNMLDDKLIEKIDLIEGYNARTETELNLQAQEFGRMKKIPIIAGSDAHFYAEIGLGRAIIEDNVSLEDIRKSILSNNTQVIGVQSPRYFRAASRIIRDVKTKKCHRLPYTLFRIAYKTIKLYGINKK